MRRSEQCRHAAATAASYARAAFSSHPEDPEKAHEQARREIYPMLCRSFARPHDQAVADLVEECRHDEQTRRDTGYDPREDDPEARSSEATENLIEILRSAMAELEELDHHRCDFHEDEDTRQVKCVICRADGLS